MGAAVAHRDAWLQIRREDARFFASWVMADLVADEDMPEGGRAAASQLSSPDQHAVPPSRGVVVPALRDWRKMREETGYLSLFPRARRMGEGEILGWLPFFCKMINCQIN